jgi:hypothetical protein
VARRVGVVLLGEHRDLIARGELTVAALADQLGVSRQAIFSSFKKRAWPTRPAAGKASIEVSPGVGSAEPAQKPVQRHQAGKARSYRPAAARAPAPAAGPPLTLPAATFADDVDLLDLVREGAANALLLAIGQAQRLLAGPIGPTGLKSTVAGLALALDQLDRVGLSLDGAGDAAAPKMIIMEHTADEVEALQREAEVAYREESPGEDADLDDDEHPLQPV